MTNLADLSHDLDSGQRRCRAVIETPRAAGGKLDYEPQSGAFRLTYVMPAGMSFPLDFGFIPSTCGEDGDPLDVMVLSEAPLPVGCVLDVRLIGVIEAEQSKDGKVLRNDRLLAVAQLSHAYAQVRALADLPADVVNDLVQFWIDYNRARRRTFKPLGLGTPARAAALIVKSGRRP